MSSEASTSYTVQVSSLNPKSINKRNTKEIKRPEYIERVKEPNNKEFKTHKSLIDSQNLAPGVPSSRYYDPRDSVQCIGGH
jgi:hypothetical protein